MKQCCQSVQQIAAIDWCAVSPIKMSSPPLALMHALNRFLKFRVDLSMGSWCIPVMKYYF